MIPADPAPTIPPLPPGTPRRIAFYGLFGQQNWGNECTLQAILYNVRRYLPTSELRCFCTDPYDTSRRHNLPALPISTQYAKGYAKGHPTVPPGPTSRFLRLFRILFLRIPQELSSWVRAVQALRGFHILIVPGTGLLTDYSSSPMGFPYRLLKWALVAKLCRCKLLFVSIGAGPMRHPLTRWFIRAALSLSEYRSYRDTYSKHFVEAIGFDTSQDYLYPDLAFSLPPSLFPRCDAHTRPKTVIGLGVKEHYGKLGLSGPATEASNQEFLSKLDRLVTWLLEHDYRVRLLIGDTLYDNVVREHIKKVLAMRGLLKNGSDLISAPISSVEDVVSELAASDIVVSPRYHNIVLALMLCKPAISLSYHQKFESLMTRVGLEAYCHDIDNLNIDILAKQIRQLEKSRDSLREVLRGKCEKYRGALEEQYARVFN
jgi:polysaccharide pyruvyl transferase WcaK-like protein